jgi:hypothetical protein
VVNVVINQPAPALYIQPPMFDITVPIHTSVKMRCRNGTHADTVSTECDTADERDDAMGLVLGNVYSFIANPPRSDRKKAGRVKGMFTQDPRRI